MQKNVLYVESVYRRMFFAKEAVIGTGMLDLCAVARLAERIQECTQTDIWCVRKISCFHNWYRGNAKFWQILENIYFLS